MSEQILIIDHEECEERIENSLEEFFKKLEGEDTLEAWINTIKEGMVRIYKIQNGKFKEVKVRPKIHYSILEE